MRTLFALDLTKQTQAVGRELETLHLFTSAENGLNTSPLAPYRHEERWYAASRKPKGSCDALIEISARGETQTCR